MKKLFSNLIGRFGTALLLLASIAKISAADVTTDFASGNKLYAEGKFADAATVFKMVS